MTLLTGFGPFGEVQSNPSEALAKHFNQRARTHTQVLPVAAKRAEKQIETMLSSYSSALLLIHLGVATETSHFALEEYASNKASFRVCDNDGWQPCDAPIEPELPSGCCIQCRSATHLSDICAQLNADGFECTLSYDAGHFVCNYVYFKSLQLIQNSKYRNRFQWCCFVHVPPFDYVDETMQVRFVDRLLQLLESLLPNDATANAD